MIRDSGHRSEDEGIRPQVSEELLLGHGFPPAFLWNHAGSDCGDNRASDSCGDGVHLACVWRAASRRGM
jgi:hypothetical protein